MAEKAELGIWARLAEWLRRRSPFAFARPAELPAHLVTGRRGEELAYRHLRRQGYVMVARNWRVKGFRGELDLVGWEGRTLCFIEVKTRSSRAAGEHGLIPAELAVDRAKQEELRRMAKLFLRSQPEQTSSRFDVVSVYFPAMGEPEIEVFKDAFAWRTMGGFRRR
jgi:putative endonuclease